MSIIATAVKHLIAAGVTGDDLVRAIADMEDQSFGAVSTKTARQERNARYYARKASEKRLNSDGQDVSDGVDNLSSPEGSSPTPPSPKPLQSIPPSPPKGGSSPADETDFVIAEYRQMAIKAGLASPRSITVSRRKQIAARLREHGLPAMLEAIGKMGASGFCCGINDRGWKADIDFLCQPKSFVNLLEGKYDNRQGSQSQAPPHETAHARHQRECREAIQQELNGNRGHDEFTSGPAFDLEKRDYRAH